MTSNPEELVAFSADGKFLATANGAAIQLWDIASGKLVQIIDASGWPVTGVSWLPESNLLVTLLRPMAALESGGQRTTAKPWDYSQCIPL